MNRQLASRIIRAIFAIIVTLLLVRLAILGLGANPDSPLINFLLAASYPLTIPFQPFFKPLPPLGFVGIDWAALAALVFALLTTWVILHLLHPEPES